VSQMDRLRALILQHEDSTPPGLISEWLGEHGAVVDTFRIDLEDREVDPIDYDLIVSLGSEFAAFDDTKPFVAREAALMRRAVDADVSVLGLCFGGQLLARVLGGKVFRAEKSEIGWLSVKSRDPVLVPDGPWFQWHFDTFTVPPGAQVIAESDVGPAAFVAGRMVVSGSLTIGDFVAFNLLLAMLIVPLRSLGMWVGQAQRATASGERIFEVMDEPEGVDDRPGAGELPAGTFLEAEIIGSQGYDLIARPI